MCPESHVSAANLLDPFAEVNISMRAARWVGVVSWSLGRTWYHRLPGCRIAGFLTCQPWNTQAGWALQAPADWKSAIQQIGNLRYKLARVRGRWAGPPGRGNFPWTDRLGW